MEASDALDAEEPGIVSEGPRGLPRRSDVRRIRADPSRTPSEPSMRRFAALLAAAGLLALDASAPRPARAADDAELVVGVILPMSGDVATYGEESWNGI